MRNMNNKAPLPMIASPFTASLFLKKSLNDDFLLGASFFIVGVRVADGRIPGDTPWLLLFEPPYTPEGFCPLV